MVSLKPVATKKKRETKPKSFFPLKLPSLRKLPSLHSAAERRRLQQTLVKRRQEYYGSKPKKKAA